MAERLSDGRIDVHGDLQFELGHAATSLHGCWKWDGARLTVEGDRFGFLPFFYVLAEDKVVIATRIGDILAAGIPADIDEVGLSTFYWFRQLIGERTLFSHIKKLPPQGRLIWSPDTASCTGEQVRPGQTALSRTAAQEQYGHVFSDAMRRLLDTCKTSIVPLTGGQDSRHILLETWRQGRQPAYTVTAEHHPIRANEDWRIAQTVSRAVNVPHKVLATGSDYVRDEYSKLPELGWMSFEHVFALPLVRHLRQAPYPFFDGLGGDVLSAGLYLTPEKHELFEAGRFQELARHILSGGPERALAVMPRWRRYFDYDAAVEEVAGELRRQEGQPNPVSAFYFWTRTRRNVSLAPLLLMASEASPPLCPYIEADVVDFLLSQPAEHFFDHTFHAQTIQAEFPEYADLPFEAKPAAPRPGYGFFLKAAATIARIAARDGSGLASPVHFVPRIARLLVPLRLSTSHLYWLRDLLFLISFGRELKTLERSKAGSSSLCDRTIDGSRE